MLPLSRTDIDLALLCIALNSGALPVAAPSKAVAMNDSSWPIPDPAELMSNRITDTVKQSQCESRAVLEVSPPPPRYLKMHRAGPLSHSSVSSSHRCCPAWQLGGASV